MANPVVLYDPNQKPMAVENGTVLPANTQGVLIHGRDVGGTARSLVTDASGNLVSTISDGTNGPAAVKLASTPPTVSDKALVVVLSPNQQAIPTTTGAVNSITGISSGRVILGGGTANILVAIRATPYNEPTVNAQRSLSSSGASDAAAGTGARQVTLIYYTATGTGPFTEIVTLNGLSVVATTNTNICFIESMVVTSVGAGGANSGTITLFVNNVGGGGTIGTIGGGNLVTAVGDNRTLWAHHYVPDTKMASLATFVVSAVSGGSGTQGTFFIRSRDPRVATDPEVIVSDILLVTASFSRQLGIPIKATGFKKLTAYGIPGVNNATLNVSFDFSEV